MFKQVLVRYFSLLAAGALMFTSIVAVPSVAFADRHDNPNGDCDSNAVMRCGVRNESSLKHKYDENQQGDTKKIFRHFGINNQDDLDGMVRGRIEKDGDVYVGDKKVATDAETAGRKYMPGSKKISGVDAYKREPHVSFRSDSLDALVKLDEKGEFEHAVIMSCGNPVKAKAIKKHKEHRKEKKVKIVGDVECENLNVVHIDNWTYRFEADARAEHAEIESYEFHFGDGLVETVETNGFSADVEHSYSKPAEYHAKVIVNAEAEYYGRTKSKSDQCTATVSIDIPDDDFELEPKHEPKPEPELKPKEVGDFEIKKEVRIVSTSTADDEIWIDDNINAEPGDKIEYRITVTNTGNVDLIDVYIHDSLPLDVDHESMDPLDSEGDVSVEGKRIANLVGNGIEVSRLNPGEHIAITFEVEIEDDADACEVPMRNVARASAKNVAEKDDEAFVTVCPPEEPEEPVDEDDGEGEFNHKKPIDEPSEFDDDFEEEPHVEGDVDDFDEEDKVSEDHDGKGGGKLPATGAVGAVGLFSVSSMFGMAAYKLKDLFLLLIR